MPRGLERAVEAEQEAVAAGELDLQMRARLVQADMLERTGRVTAAARLATEVNWWARQHGPQPLLARSHLILSSIFETVGDAESCLDHALRAVELLGEATPMRSRGNFLVRLGDAYAVAGAFDAARERYDEADRLFAAIGDPERRLNVLNNLAYAEYEAGDAQRAGQAAEAMRSLAQSSGLDLNPTYKDTLARTQMLLGEYEEAERTLRDALAELESGGDVQAVTPAELMLSLAETQRRLGRLEQAQETLDRCRAICVERYLSGVEVEVLREQAELYAAGGRFDRALEAYKVFHAELLSLSSNRRESAARTRQAMFGTPEAREEARRFRRQARTDALTALPNRRFVNEELPIRINEVAGGLSLVVAAVDADRLTAINNSLSHETGDRVIRELGHSSRGSWTNTPPPRDSRGFAARLGGDEFLVVLPGLEPADAPQCSNPCERRSRPTRGPRSSATCRSPSASAPRPPPPTTRPELLTRVDRNLYAAKKAGRNRVVSEGR